MTTALQRKQRKCTHWYVFESPHGPTVRGMCRKCGKGRRLPSATEATGYGYGNREQRNRVSLKKGKKQ